VLHGATPGFCAVSVGVDVIASSPGIASLSVFVDVGGA
jgi:hypothetical protein